jgi:hypothetical protein
MGNFFFTQIKLSKRYLYILYLSFLPLLTKGVTYLLLGSWHFIILSLIIIASILYNIHISKSKSSKIIKVWSLLLIGYGVIRLLLASINLFIDSIESTIVYQLTLWYHFQSMLYILFGVVLFTKRLKIE